jgi:hypothetical protein
VKGHSLVTKMTKDYHQGVRTFEGLKWKYSARKCATISAVSHSPVKPHLMALSACTGMTCVPSLNRDIFYLGPLILLLIMREDRSVAYIPIHRPIHLRAKERLIGRIISEQYPFSVSLQRTISLLRYCSYS